MYAKKTKVNIIKKNRTVNVAIDVDKWKILKHHSIDIGKSLKEVLNELIEDNLR